MYQNNLNRSGMISPVKLKKIPLLSLFKVLLHVFWVDGSLWQCEVLSEKYKQVHYTE